MEKEKLPWQKRHLPGQDKDLIKPGNYKEMSKANKNNEGLSWNDNTCEQTEKCEE